MVKERFINEVVPLRSKLIGYACRLLKDQQEAEDTVQEAMLKLYLLREELGRYKSIEVFAVTVVKRICLNKIRDRKKKYGNGTDPIALMQDTAAAPDQQLEQKDDVGHVIRILELLPPLQQTVVRLKHIEDLSVEEIAQITGTRAEAVRMNLSRGRKMIVQRLMNIQKL